MIAKETIYASPDEALEKTGMQGKQPQDTTGGRPAAIEKPCYFCVSYGAYAKVYDMQVDAEGTTFVGYYVDGNITADEETNP